MSDHPSRNVVDEYSPRVALFAAVGLTATGEFSLAHLAGFPGLIAALLPTAIDVYVVQAMRRHRDVPAALVLMVLTNALFHLAHAKLFGVDAKGHATWWLIVAVSAIAPLIVWRVHRITESGEVVVPVVETSAGPAAVLAVPELATERPEVATAPVDLAPPVVVPDPAPTADSSTPSVAPVVAAEPPTPAASAPPVASAKNRNKTARSAAKKAPRRSLDEWVELAGTIFHAEFRRLRRQPTANEFATAIEAAGLGRVSDSTAKNIRTEILDRTDVPALD